MSSKLKFKNSLEAKVKKMKTIIELLGTVYTVHCVRSTV